MFYCVAHKREPAALRSQATATADRGLPRVWRLKPSSSSASHTPRVERCARPRTGGHPRATSHGRPAQAIDGCSAWLEYAHARVQGQHFGKNCMGAHLLP